MSNFKKQSIETFIVKTKHDKNVNKEHEVYFNFALWMTL